MNTGRLRWIVLLLALLGACSEPQAPLRVGLLVWPAYEPPFLARHLGLYEGRQIDLVEFQSPADVIRAYGSGSVDVLAVTVDYALQLASLDPSQRIVFVIDASNGADTLLARPEIETLPDLRGKRVGIEKSALGGFMLRRALDHAGLDYTDVEVVSVDLPETVESYREGKLDAVVTYEPYRSQIKKMGARELFTSRDIPGEIIDVLVTKTDVIERHEEQLAAFIAGWLMAVDEMRRKPLPSAEIMARREGITARQFLQALEDISLMDHADNHSLLAGEQPGIVDAMRKQYGAIREDLQLQSEPDYRQLIDTRFFPRASP